MAGGELPTAVTPAALPGPPWARTRAEAVEPTPSARPAAARAFPLETPDDASLFKQDWVGALSDCFIVYLRESVGLAGPIPRFLSEEYNFPR